MVCIEYKVASPRSVSGSVLYSFHITCQYFIDNRNIEFATCVNTDASDLGDPHIDMCLSGQQAAQSKSSSRAATTEQPHFFVRVLEEQHLENSISRSPAPMARSPASPELNTAVAYVRRVVIESFTAIEPTLHEGRLDRR